MGRPLSRQQFFGADSTENIKVHFHNGTTGVKGYILRQRSTKRFLCSDVNGVTRVCKLVDKVRADLLEGEMSVAFVFDDATKAHAVKIARHRIRVYYNGQYRSMLWTFDENNSDGRWQIDEAGTNTSMASDTDVGGEDINGDYPVPGSGDFQTAVTALTGVVYANKGTPYNPGGNVASVPNSAPGLYRKKYNGNFCTASNSLPGTWTYDWFDTAQFIKGIADTYVSWGHQSDGPGLGQHNFSMEWKGYIKVPTTQNYNIYAESDDHIAMWIGTDALNDPQNNTRLLGNNNKTMPDDKNVAGVYGTNSVTLTAGQYYPVRIWFSEFEGGCKAQIYLHGANDIKLYGPTLTDVVHNSATKGF